MRTRQVKFPTLSRCETSNNDNLLSSWTTHSSRHNSRTRDVPVYRDQSRNFASIIGDKARSAMRDRNIRDIRSQINDKSSITDDDDDDAIRIDFSRAEVPGIVSKH